MVGSALTDDDKVEVGFPSNGPEPVALSIGRGSHSDAPSNKSRTVVLVGRTGNGKSATCNHILGRVAFTPRSCSFSAGISRTCEMQTRKLSGGQMLNVIDSPGLFDVSSCGSEFIGEVIGQAINMAKDGIDAVLVVFSVRTRFTKEEGSVLRGLQILCGEKISDYVIVVFTGGDSLEEDGVTLDEYIGRECPDPLKEILGQCGNRKVLFDNKTKDEAKKSRQLEQLLSLLDGVIELNHGQPYKEKLNVDKLKEEALKLRGQTEKANSLKGCMIERSEFKDQLPRSSEEQAKRMTEMAWVDNDSSYRRLLEQQLAEEKAARLKAEEEAEARLRVLNELYSIRRQREIIAASKEGRGSQSWMRCRIM
ncbi:immune-associated nucleotide-binding protein 9-like [Diospyros lotus]|uniref:immune-associated nucleotide-binding protein 9-like n=1 Tax=Diospyros lotus TaxID=55363 RepID=UPI00224EF702|nr:immune-associated nucleotide-binding protein 9-like [Diospyros lotus]